jgi:putative phosphoribosyl transferase
MRTVVSETLRPYRDRRDAGRRLAGLLEEYAGRRDLQLFAIPRGGVPVAHEVARRLGAPLDVVVVRKLGLPSQPELAMGAIAAGGVQVLNRDVLDLGVPDAVVAEVARRELAEVARRETAYRLRSPALNPRDMAVIVIDDGLATGSTMRAAMASLRTRGAATIVVAVPVGAERTCDEIEQEVDQLVCPLRPAAFFGVGEWFADFSQTTDDEVVQLLESAHLFLKLKPPR